MAAKGPQEHDLSEGKKKSLPFAPCKRVSQWKTSKNYQAQDLRVQIALLGKDALLSLPSASMKRSGVPEQKSVLPAQLVLNHWWFIIKNT